MICHKAPPDGLARAPKPSESRRTLASSTQRGADHVDISGRGFERILTWRAAMRFHFATRFHLARRLPLASRFDLASRFRENMARGIAQLAGARTSARGMERSGQRHGDPDAAASGSIARLFIRLRACGTAHVVAELRAVNRATDVDERRYKSLQGSQKRKGTVKLSTSNSAAHACHRNQ